MGKSHNYDRFRYTVQPALATKVNEFRFFGYNTITEQALWEYLTQKKWKKIKADIHLYEVVQDILSVKVSDWISFTTIETYKFSDAILDEEERRALLQ